MPNRIRETSEPFLVLGLPRSRTFWLSKFLTYGEYQCSHEESRHIRGIDDVRSWLSQGYVGSTETSAARWATLARAIRPELRIAVIRRPVSEAVDSLMRLDLNGIIAFDRDALSRKLHREDRALDRVERLPGVLSVRFDDLILESTCKRVFEHCLPYEHDHAQWASIALWNMQCDMRALMRYMVTHAHQIVRTGHALRRQMREIISGPRQFPELMNLDGMVIRQERFETFWQGAQQALSEHCVEIGEEEDQFTRKNVPFFRLLDQVGAGQIITARQNGRMFGYLICLLGPHLEHKGETAATQMTFFVSKDARGTGLGMKLLRASIDSAKAKGASEVVLYSGIRGDGPRLGTLYKRVGAKDNGHIYRLNLRAA